MKLFAGNSNRVLAEAVARYLNIPLGKASVRRFADQEIFVEINENVRGEDVFVLQSTSYPANDHLMELLIMIDALRRSSARRMCGFEQVVIHKHFTVSMWWSLSQACRALFEYYI